MRTLALFLFLNLLTFIPANAQQRSDMNKSRVIDEKINIGDRSLYIKCFGSESPTVILEAAFSSPSSDWDKVIPEVGKFTRVCAYDRANIGKSDAAPKPRTIDQITNDLHVLLEKAGEKAPFVFAGHSFGGIYSIFYANRYPKDVAGMVLVDSSHEDQVRRFDEIMTPEQKKESSARRANSNIEGIDTTAVRDELRTLKWKTTIPLYVLMHGKAAPDMIPPGWSAEQLAKRTEAWREMQTDFSSRSPKGKLIVARESGHYIQNDQPELVINAIRQIVKKLR